jgi:hypothetical protein
VTTNKEKPASTKRGAFSQLAKVYDFLSRFGLANDIAWEAPLSGNVRSKPCLGWGIPWNLNEAMEGVVRTVPRTLHSTEDIGPNNPSCRLVFTLLVTIEDWVAAAVYAVIEQEYGTTQGLVCSKSRIAKRNLAIPRLELVSGHMAANLVTNVETAIGNEKVTSVHCWLDSTVALYWINGQGDWFIITFCLH